jgi:biopolymer transport protein ExbB
MLELFTKGGMFMYLILGVSVFGFAIILERAYQLYLRYRIDEQGLLRNVIGAVDSQQYHRAMELCNRRSSHPLTRVLKAGLTKGNRSDKEIQRAMEEEAVRVAPKVNARVNYLAMLSNVSTLLGLLGTIFGLIAAFKGVGLADAAMKQQALAKGISVAMFTTAFGLIVAIPLLIAFHILQNKANAIIETIQESGITLLNHLSTINRQIVEKKKLTRIA